MNKTRKRKITDLHISEKNTVHYNTTLDYIFSQVFITKNVQNFCKTFTKCKKNVTNTKKRLNVPYYLDSGLSFAS